jgi:hypothetical protein
MNRRTRRGAAVGAVAGVTWMAVEPLLQRGFRSPYSDPGIVCGIVARGRARLAAEVVTQAVGGAIFGAAFVRFGGRGAGRAVTAALVENAVLWPGVGILQRYHPDVRDGRWPRPLTDPRAIGVSFAGHAIFGVLLGLLLDPPHRP